MAAGGGAVRVSGADGQRVADVTQDSGGVNRMASDTTVSAISTFSDRTGTGSISALNGAITVNTQGCNTIIFDTTGTWVGTIRVEGSNDNFTTQQLLTTVDSVNAVAATYSSNSRIVANCSGYAQTRLRASAYTSGTISVTYGAAMGMASLRPFNDNASSFKVASRSDILSLTGSAGSLNADISSAIDVGGYSTVELQISGTWVGTITFQGSDDNVTFFSVQGTDISSPIKGPTSTTTANGAFYIPLSFRYFRARMTAYTSGTATSAYTFDTLTAADIQARYTIPTDGTNTSKITTHQELLALDYGNNGGVQGALTVGTTAVLVNVSGSNLANRTLVTLNNNSAAIMYWGYDSAVTTSTGTPIVPTQTAAWKVGPNTNIYVIAGTASNNGRVTEGS